jgi:hypothetical protein
MFTNTQSENLDNLPSVGGIGGSYGGAWPATIWKTFMAAKFNNLTVDPLPTPDYTGFTMWNQVAPTNQNQNQNPNPNPTPNPQPNPHPSCVPSGQPCSSPSPNPQPSPSPTCTPSPEQPCAPNPSPTCTPSPGQPCVPGPGPADIPAAAAAIRSQAADEPARAVARPRASPAVPSGGG